MKSELFLEGIRWRFLSTTTEDVGSVLGFNNVKWTSKSHVELVLVVYRLIMIRHELN